MPYLPYPQNRNDSLTGYLEHERQPDGHAIRLKLPVRGTSEAGLKAIVQLCHAQPTETAAIKRTISRLQATVDELETILRVKEGR